MKNAHSMRMSFDRRRTLLFLLCAVVLLGAGFTWGYGNAYGRFYSPDATLDRELVQLDFDSRVLHHLNSNQRMECRRDLLTQLRQEVVFLRGVVSGASVDAQRDADRKLQQAENVLDAQPTGDNGLTQAAIAR